MKALHVAGARPNFPKLAPVEKALRELGHAQYLVHTGQHFDDNLSDVFFRELSIPRPDVNLEVGSSSHARQTADVMVALEPVLTNVQPDVVVVYGDVNSTVAAALVATKLHIPLVHVEAGLRSGDRTMPEELNRLVVDTLADELLTTAQGASDNLVKEGVDPTMIHFVGNPMIDTLLAHRDRVEDFNPARDAGIVGKYILVTLHRPGNVDSKESAQGIVSMLEALASELPVLFPIHPRTRARLTLDHVKNLHTVSPLGYFSFLAAMARSAVTVTDSGGVQEETTILGVPCLTVRPNTERPVTITDGSNQLVSPMTAPQLAADLLNNPPLNYATPPLWDGRAGARIARIIEKRFG